MQLWQQQQVLAVVVGAVMLMARARAGDSLELEAAPPAILGRSCGDQLRTFNNCTDRGGNAWVGIQPDGRKDLIERKSCNRLQQIEECVIEVDRICRLPDFHPMLDRSIQALMDPLTRDLPNWDTNKCPTAWRMLNKEGTFHDENTAGLVWSPLVEAGRRDHVQVIATLLQLGDDINTQDDQGFTALMAAAQAHNGRSINRLLSMNATMDLRNKDGSTALILACQSNPEDNYATSLMHTPSIDFKNKEGTTALMAAADSGNERAVYGLLAANAEVDLRNNGGWTALMFAAQKGHQDRFDRVSQSRGYRMERRDGIVPHLIKKGASVDLRNNHGETALMLAAKNGHLRTVNYLLAHNATVDFEDTTRITALRKLQQYYLLNRFDLKQSD